MLRRGQAENDVRRRKARAGIGTAPRKSSHHNERVREQDMNRLSMMKNKAILEYGADELDHRELQTDL